MRAEGASGGCGRKVRTEGAQKVSGKSGDGVERSAYISVFSFESLNNSDRQQSCSVVNVVAGARTFEELICWQLACELKARVYRILERESVEKDLDFCRQIRKSTRAAPALIAVGFGRWTRPEFVRYLRLAKGELGETRNHLKDGLESSHLGVDEFRELRQLCYRADRACRGLILSLLRKIEQDRKRKKRHT